MSETGIYWQDAHGNIKSEYGTATGISFITSKGIKKMEPGKSYDENIDEIQPIRNEVTKV